MEKSFWLDKWQRNEIGFHNPQAHPLLVKHFPKLGLEPGARLFLPLCGKTLDIGWLLGQGYRVVGAELSEMAVEQLFEQLSVAPEISEHGELKRYRAQDIDIYAGDIFQLQRELLSEVDGIYDRAALVALPESMRREYAQHLQHLTGNAPQLLITFDYDQTQLPGPPFCVSDDEVAQLYGDNYRLTLIDAVEVPGGLKGRCEALEKVWLVERAE
ncbi:thiopurine S-methyltransferase [Microbulbifer pacificus]|uniref:Thiopurine S-methyltransferase n=1 Tax=Microbulbifer pacificus TaxID=407164 RepID=A0AAU0N097_9GAMM|nr:thiopurine S-methyltransferase [Microbulbifer pacificus]WOX05763.1 thiopurine S-methyltransferase [Microbulbifer pacificus]